MADHCWSGTRWAGHPGADLPLILMLAAAGGVPLMAFNVSQATLLQTSGSSAYRGRLLGAYGASGAGLALVGTTLATLLGDRLSIVLLPNVSGALWVGAAALALALLPKHVSPAPPHLSSDAGEISKPG